MRRFNHLLFIAFLCSCQKEEGSRKETISGIVIHNITAAPLIDQELVVTINTIRSADLPAAPPIMTTTNYITHTDNAGKYNFSLEIPSRTGWYFSVRLVNAQYTEKPPAVSPTGPFTSNMLLASRWYYDTILAERSGYVRYHVKNINDSYSDDTLKAETYYRSKTITGNSTGNFVFIPDGYNWHFFGSTTDRIIIDTIPAESEPQIPINWVHNRNGTIISKNEMINVSPGITSDYAIHY